MQTVTKSLPRAHLLVSLRANCWVKVVRSLDSTRKLATSECSEIPIHGTGCWIWGNNINLHIDGVNIKQLKSIKLSREHNGSVCKKASQQIGVLRRLRMLIPTHAKVQLHKAAILPHLTYCSTIWHFCRASDKRKVKDYRREPLRVVFNNESVFYNELLRLAELPSLVNSRLQEIAILMFKAKKNQLPSQIQELFMLIHAESKQWYEIVFKKLGFPST